MERADVLRLLQDYNSNPKAYSDDDANVIAQLAKSYNVNFKRSGKAGQKFFFDLADTALLGLIPNEWRPEARGDAYFGESGLDKFAGSAGSALGIIGTAGAAGAGAWAGRHAIGRGIGKGIGYGIKGGQYAAGKSVEYAGKASAYARELARNMPEYTYQAGVKSGQGRVAYSTAKSQGLTSLERGRTTSWFSNLRDEFARGRRMADPMSSYDPNLLRLTDGGLGGVPLAGGGGVML